MALMRYQTLGNSGLLVSVVGLGCNNFGGRLDEASTRAVVDAAIESGVTLFDTADMYGERGGSESYLGEALAGRRDQVVLATKFGHQAADMGYGPAAGAKGGRGYIRRAVEESLRRLRTDYIDLYQLHTPDPSTPIAETLAALSELVAEGKVRYIGHSNLSGWQIADAEYRAQLAGHSKFISAQNEYSLIVRDVESEVLPAVRQYGLGFLPFFPLFQGVFTGKYSRSGERATDGRLTVLRPELLGRVSWDAMDQYQAFCDERGISMLDATLGWFLAQSPVSSVIAGATKPEQVAQNAAAATAWRPSDDEVRAISGFFPRN